MVYDNERQTNSYKTNEFDGMKFDDEMIYDMKSNR